MRERQQERRGGMKGETRRILGETRGGRGREEGRREGQWERQQVVEMWRPLSAGNYM